MMHRWAHGKANMDGWTILVAWGDVEVDSGQYILDFTWTFSTLIG